MTCRRRVNVVKEAEKSVCDADAHEEGTLPINQYNLILLQLVSESLQDIVG
jgi:hypothetical protein